MNNTGEKPIIIQKCNKLSGSAAGTNTKYIYIYIFAHYYVPGSFLGTEQTITNVQKNYPMKFEQAKFSMTSRYIVGNVK